MRLDNKAANYLKAKMPKTKNNHLWSYVDELKTQGLELRRPFERSWIINLAFLNGKQYSYFNKSTHAIQELVRLAGKRYCVDNILVSKWRRQVADLIKNDPEMSVVPETSDDQDIRAAKTGDKTLKHFFRQNKMKEKIRILAGWMYATGNGFIDDRWNSKLGPTQMTEEGDLIYLGDVDCGVWNPFELIFPQAETSDGGINTLPWMQKIKWRTLEYIQNNYKEGDKVTAEERSQDQTMSLTSLFGYSTLGTKNEMAQGAYLIETYVQPSKEFPKGRFIVASNKVILRVQDYPFTTYNIEQFKDIEIPGCLWGKATLEDAIGLQNRWNRTLNSIDEYNEVMAKGKLLTPRGAKLTVLPDDGHGERIEYKPVMGHKPEHMQLKGLPSTYPLILEATSRSLDDLFSQHEVSRGTNKSDIRSGEMVSLLREQDAHGNIPSHNLFEEALERVMSRVLKRIQEGYDGERMLKIVGNDGEWEVLAFKGSDLRNNTDVSVKRQSSLPDSRIAREAMIMQKFERGLYGDPADPEVRRRVMNMLDDAIVKDIFSEERLDEANAKRENQILVSGRATDLRPNNFDNDQIHVKTHNKFRKSADYQNLKFKDPKGYLELDTIFTAHIMVHQQRIEEQIKRMIAQQNAINEKGEKNVRQKG